MIFELRAIHFDEMPFFTLFQAFTVCSCAQKHLTYHSKFALRIVHTIPKDRNIDLVRELLVSGIGEFDQLTFQDEEGREIQLDYEGLKNMKHSRIMVFIYPQEQECITRLEKENKKRGWAIYEDPLHPMEPEKGGTQCWVKTAEDATHETEDGQLHSCEACMQIREREIWVEYMDEARRRDGHYPLEFDEVYPMTIYQHASDCDKAGSKDDASEDEGGFEDSANRAIPAPIDPEFRAQYDFFVSELISELDIRPKHMELVYHIPYAHRWDTIFSTETPGPLSWSKPQKKRQALASDTQYESTSKRLRTMR